MSITLLFCPLDGQLLDRANGIHCPIHGFFAEYEEEAAYDKYKTSFKFTFVGSYIRFHTIEAIDNMLPNTVDIESNEPAVDAATLKADEDVVNHPNHYNQYEGFEVIDVCEQLRAPDGTGNYNRGNAFKYLARAGWKNPEKHVEDLEKAKFYIQREIDRIQQSKKENDEETVPEFSPRCPTCNIDLVASKTEKGMFECPKKCGCVARFFLRN